MSFRSIDVSEWLFWLQLNHKKEKLHQLGLITLLAVHNDFEHGHKETPLALEGSRVFQAEGSKSTVAPQTDTQRLQEKKRKNGIGRAYGPHSFTASCRLVSLLCIVSLYLVLLLPPTITPPFLSPYPISSIFLSCYFFSFVRCAIFVGLSYLALSFRPSSASRRNNKVFFLFLCAKIKYFSFPIYLPVLLRRRDLTAFSQRSSRPSWGFALFSSILMK